MKNAPAASLRNVIQGDYCIGCGACSAVDSSFIIDRDSRGMRRVMSYPNNKQALTSASAVCPFANAPNETEIADSIFDKNTIKDEYLGRYTSLYAGFSVDNRAVAGSGGVTRWLMAELLKSGEVDFVVCVNENSQTDSGFLFSYAIHETADSFLNVTSSSAYYPVSLTEVLTHIQKRKGRFAVTALPCFARALRALAHRDPALGDRLAFISGVVCGGLKSERYAAYLALQMGVRGSSLDRINFRGKTLSQAANEKCVEVWTKDRDEKPKVARVQELLGTDYGSGYFKPKACDYCDDVFAETADIAFGDAWISPYKDDPLGTNIIVVRSRLIDRVLQQAAAKGDLHLERLTIEQVVASQASGLRHRRQGLSVRLRLAQLRGRWTPEKRVAAAWGTGGFVLQQLVRIAIRRFTSWHRVSLDAKLFHSIAWRLTEFHKRVRPMSLKRQPKSLGRLKKDLS